jgi:hypothetical protein
MTKSEFIQNNRTGMQKGRRLLFCGLVSLGVCLLAAAAFGTEPIKEGIVCFGVVLFFAFMVLATVAQGRPPRCRRCGKRLEGFSSQIAVATGYCGFCGELAFEEEKAK